MGEQEPHGRAALGRRKVLVVEDDARVRDLVCDRLEREGFSVHSVGDGGEVLDAISSKAPDLVLLDLVLPNVDGFDLLKMIRRTNDVPIIVITGRREEADRVVGLELGADDYLVKPFSPRELVARIRSVLRRAQPALPRATRLEFDGLAIDALAREVFVNGELVPTTSREFELLQFLASSPRQVFSREQLLKQIWRSELDWQDGGTVTEHVYRLRRKIEDDPARPQWITTAWGVGYRFEPGG